MQSGQKLPKNYGGFLVKTSLPPYRAGLSGLLSLVRKDGSDEGHATFRSRRMNLSMLTSIASKGVSSVLQIVVIPLAINALGADRFGVYATLAATLGWVNMAGIGIGPGLTLGTASAVAAGDRNREARLFTTAFALILILTFITLTFLALGIFLLGIQSIFGSKLGVYQHEIGEGMVVLMLLLGANLVLSLVEAVQAGYQSQYVNNLWATLGNIFTIGMLLLVISHWRSITGMIIAVYGSLTVAKVFNAGQLFWRHPYLVPRLKNLDKILARMLIGTGLVFLLGQVAGFLYLEFNIFLVGRELGPSSAAGFAVMIQMLVLAGGMVIMITLPLWPAVADAWVRGDRAWIISTYKRTTLGLMTYAVLVGGIVALAGNLIVDRWVGPQVVPSFAMQLWSGIYFVMTIWQNINHAFLIGLGKVRLASLCLLSGGIIMMVANILLVKTFGNSGVVFGMCLGLSLTAFSFPVVVIRSLRAEVDVNG